MTISGETKRSLRSKASQQDNKAFYSIILQSTTAFLDAYLHGHQDAEQWLDDGGFTALAADRGEVEMAVKE